MRASLLARAIASMLRCSLLDACSIQGHKPRIAALGRRASTTCAACTNSVRRYLLPRLEILPRIVRSPVDSCFGTSPSHAPKSRPCVNPAPLPIAATKATRDDRADPRHCHHPLASLILFHERFDVSRHRCNALVQTTPVLDQLADEIDYSWRQRTRI